MSGDDGRRPEAVDAESNPRRREQEPPCDPRPAKYMGIREQYNPDHRCEGRRRQPGKGSERSPGS